MYLLGQSRGIGQILSAYTLCVKKFDQSSHTARSTEVSRLLLEYIKNDKSYSYLNSCICHSKNENMENCLLYSPYIYEIFRVTEYSDPFAEYVKGASIDEKLQEAILKLWGEQLAIIRKNSKIESAG